MSDHVSHTTTTERWEAKAIADAINERISGCDATIENEIDENDDVVWAVLAPAKHEAWIRAFMAGWRARAGYTSM